MMGLIGSSGRAAERIVFLGDSITQAGVEPGGYVTLFRAAVAQQYPDAAIEVIGAGISGNRVPDLQRRLDRDVLEKEPTTVVIYIGINDVWHSINGRGTPKDEFRAGLQDIIGRIQAKRARVVLCTPSVIGEKTDGSNSLDAMLDEYCAVSREVAAATNSQLLDLRRAFLEHLKGANASQAGQGILTTDGVHLNAAGNQFVADQMLKSINVGNSVPGKLLRHIVLFKFKEGTPPEKIDEIAQAFAALPGKIDTVVEFEWGTNNSPEGLDQGYTHAFFVSFRSEAGRAVYLPHPAHQEFVTLLKPHLDKVLVVDYWAQ
jgi:lysophospholipase L1-like esterase